MIAIFISSFPRCTQSAPIRTGAAVLNQSR
jgi:hypothetical protein